ncbi:hypothetical protein VA7868_01480 [Vibrio aerogenes CECT 7868]|uniref:Thiol-disulfide oxidoreductase DCC n=1 Tax=Vibrio aerogenes CECT 7868 TaxID=1216006 RepID=A0A1M5Y4P3_9VIBR|nr:DUF393 domain-containing protein [Vibrio aerogenes]SHI06768.1 hypothetical protein VA7868_01480 [Vibrio aerogenes CECT 7868]
MITVWYDAQCGLCSREINHYRRIAPAGIFHWRDVMASETELQQHGITVAQGLLALHARDDAGTIHQGVDAFILIWRQLKRWRLLAVLIALPGIRQAAGLAYRFFANWRFQKLTHCQVAAQQEKCD